MRNSRFNTLVKVSLLGAIGFLLMFLEFALPIFPSFLQIDISDLPALVGAFALGPVAGVAIELLKNILHAVFKGSPLFIGEVANFVVGGVLVFVAGSIYKRNRTKTNAIISMIIGVVAMSIVAVLTNYFVFFPLYASLVYHMPMSSFVQMGAQTNSHVKSMFTFMTLIILPFNIIKGVVISALTAVLYKSLSPIIQGKAVNAPQQESVEN
ncbi:MAG: ECF transporter S component [Bacillota bacterium]|nr:ECF transporter S component [Bacillota bacterium]